MTIDKAEHAETAGVFLLFARGKRPDAAAIRNFAASQRAVAISHDPLDDRPTQLIQADNSGPSPTTQLPSDQANSMWIELLRDGLTFDLCGLAPGPASSFSEVEHSFDIGERHAALQMEALRLSPGHHLAGGEGTMPVARTMIALACDLTHHFDDLLAVVWPPSRSAIGRRYFESIATAWIEGGAFPALGLTAFREAMDGALQSVGLAYWIGQELRIESPLADDKAGATRLGVRLVNQLILLGGLNNTERVIAPDGTRLVMRPSDNRKFIRVWRE